MFDVGRLLVRGDNVAGVLEVDEEHTDWQNDAFPRIFAYASARAVVMRKRMKFTGNDDGKDYVDLQQQWDSRGRLG